MRATCCQGRARAQAASRGPDSIPCLQLADEVRQDPRQAAADRAEACKWLFVSPVTLRPALHTANSLLRDFAAGGSRPGIAAGLRLLSLAPEEISSCTAEVRLRAGVGQAWNALCRLRLGCARSAGLAVSPGSCCCSHPAADKGQACTQELMAGENPAVEAAGGVDQALVAAIQELHAWQAFFDASQCAFVCGTACRCKEQHQSVLAEPGRSPQMFATEQAGLSCSMCCEGVHPPCSTKGFPVPHTVRR